MNAEKAGSAINRARSASKERPSGDPEVRASKTSAKPPVAGVVSPNESNVSMTLANKRNAQRA